MVDQPGQRGGQQVDLHVLPDPGAVTVVQRGQHADGGLHPGHHVEHRDARPVGRPVRVTGQAHQTGHGLHDQVVAGQGGPTGRAEPGDGHVDDPRVGPGHGVVVQPEPGQPVGLEVLQHDVGPRGQLVGETQVGVVLEVQRDRPLVAVDAEVVGGDVATGGRQPGAGVVSTGTFHLDHLRAHVAQQHAGVGAGQDAGEVGDQQPVQGTGGVPWGLPGWSVCLDGHLSTRSLSVCRTIVRPRVSDPMAPLSRTGRCRLDAVVATRRHTSPRGGRCAG